MAFPKERKPGEIRGSTNVPGSRVERVEDAAIMGRAFIRVVKDPLQASPLQVLEPIARDALLSLELDEAAKKLVRRDRH